MKGRTYTLVFALVLLLCAQIALAPAAGADSEDSSWTDVSEYVLQGGGLLPEPSVWSSSTSGEDSTAVKTALLNGLSAWESEIDLREYNVPISDIQPILIEVLNDNPELFYVSSGFSYYSSGSYIARLIPSYDSSYTTDDISDYRSAVQRILGMVEPDWSDTEKVLFLHDYLVTHCEYDTSYQRYNAHDALVVGSAVCQGYSLAFNDLCRKSGVSSSVISSDAINHAWNLVTVNGEKAYIDCTWDDPANQWYEGYCGHGNFLLGRDAFSSSHQSTDWTSGTANVYDNAITTSRYDNEWWQEVITAVARIGHVGAYTLKGDSDFIFLRDLSNDSVSSVALPESARWPSWENSSYYWSNNFSGAATANGRFYFTLPTEIWSLSLSGDTKPVYRLTEEELSQGYLYGIVSDGDKLYYNIGTQANGVTFSRFELDSEIIFDSVVIQDGSSLNLRTTDEGILPGQYSGSVTVTPRETGYYLFVLSADDTPVHWGEAWFGIINTAIQDRAFGIDEPGSMSFGLMLTENENYELVLANISSLEELEFSINVIQAEDFSEMLNRLGISAGQSYGLDLTAEDLSGLSGTLTVPENVRLRLNSEVSVPAGLTVCCYGDVSIGPDTAMTNNGTWQLFGTMLSWTDEIVPVINNGDFLIMCDQWIGDNVFMGPKLFHYADCLVLPADVTEVEAEAFVSTSEREVSLPETVSVIGDAAFANNSHLYLVIIPTANVTITGNPFLNSPNVHIAAPAGGTVQSFAQNNGIAFLPLYQG